MKLKRELSENEIHVNFSGNFKRKFASEIVNIIFGWNTLRWPIGNAVSWCRWSWCAWESGVLEFSLVDYHILNEGEFLVKINGKILLPCPHQFSANTFRE